jgi:hypothetical protein
VKSGIVWHKRLNILSLLSLINLGEIVISHPFFSLLACLQQTKKHHGITDKDDIYLRLVDACFKNYMIFESRENLIDAFATAHILLFVYGILATNRLMLACDGVRLMSFHGHGKLSGELRKFMTACRD